MAHFIHAKYRPKKLQDFYILHDLKNILLELSKLKSLMNMILYGKNGSCKKTILLCFLNNYFNNSNIIYNTETIDFTLSNNYNYFYKVSSKHFEFNFIENSSINRYMLLEIIIPLIKNKSILNNYTIIIINNLHYLKKNITLLKNISEQYPYVIFLCTSCNYIDTSMNFIQFKSNINNYFDLLKLSLYINKHNNLNLDNIQIKNIILNSNYNINNLLNFYQEKINNKLLLKHNIEEKQPKNIDNIEEVITILLKKNINDFIIIKNILNNILIYRYLQFDKLIDIIYTKIIKHIQNKNQFIYELSNIFINNTNNNNNSNIENYNIIILDTIILCIYKYL